MHGHLRALAKEVPAMTHAYCILAHNEFPLLTRLVSTLDYPCNNLYIHIDKKVSGEVFQQVKSTLEDTVRHASIAFTPRRVDISWGDFSMVEAELLVLREASAAHHDYYHMMSGVDLPIKPHSEILRFFEEHAGEEFIQGYAVPPRSPERLRMRYYFPFQHTVGHHYFRPLGLLQDLLLLPQALVGVNRLRRLPGLHKGSQWFSATHAFVTDLLEFYSHEEHLRPYRMTLCPDEIFVTTFAFTGKYRENILLYKRYPNDERLLPSNMRLVVWEKRGAGSPMTYDMDNLSRLMESDQLWARKFSFDKHPDVVEAVLESISPDAHSLFGSELLFQLVNTDPEDDAQREALHAAIDQLPHELLLRLPDTKICEARSYAIAALINADWDSPERQAFLARYVDWQYSVSMTDREDLERMIQAVNQLEDLKALKRTAKWVKRDCRYFKREITKRGHKDDDRHARYVTLAANFNIYYEAILGCIKELKKAK